MIMSTNWSISWRAQHTHAHKYTRTGFI